MNIRNETDNSSPDSQRENGRDAVVSKKSCKRYVGRTVENTANNSTGISNQPIDCDRNSYNRGLLEHLLNRPPIVNLKIQTKETNEPFQFVKSNKNNQDPQTTSTVNNSAKFKSHRLQDKQLRNSKALIAQKGITNFPSEDSCDDSDSDSDEGTNQRNGSRAKVSSTNQASKLQIIGGKHNSPTNNTTGELPNKFTNSCFE